MEYKSKELRDEEQLIITTGRNQLVQRRGKSPERFRSADLSTDTQFQQKVSELAARRAKARA